MKNKHNPSVSLEQFSAYMDGNLPTSEMDRISSIISKDDVLMDMVNESMEIEDAEDYYSDSSVGSESISFAEDFTLPDIENISSGNELISDFSDNWLDSEPSTFIDGDSPMDTSGLLASNQDNNTSEDFSKESPELIDSSNNSGNMKDNVNYGYKPNPSESTFDTNIYQGDHPSCAVRSQEIILRDYGISIPQDELIKFATENGWYSDDPNYGGTPREATGNILDALGIETKRFDNATIFDIVSELRAGHRIIVSVDANELWIKNEPSLRKRLFGELSNRFEDKVQDIVGIQGANHALIVAGVNVNPDDPSDMKVVLIDSGSGYVCIEYKFSDFKKAWDDSHCHMVTTTQAAPFQYNYETHQMEPSNFQTDFMPSMVVLPTGLHNQFELPTNYFDEYGDVTPEYNAWDRVIPFWENWNDEEYPYEEQMIAMRAASSSDDHHTEDDVNSLEEEDETSNVFEDDSTDESSEEDSSASSNYDDDDSDDNTFDSSDENYASDSDNDNDF